MTRFFQAALTMVFLVGFGLSSAPVHGQIVASELASVSQTADGTVFTVDYSRPSLRGRSDVFRTEVADSVLWTPGANWATTINITGDVEIEGTPVPAGKYSVWMVVTAGDWELVLDPKHRAFHVPHPARTDSQYVITVRPDTTAPVVESLQWSFPSVRSTGVDLRMHWERTAVTVAIKVEPTRVITVAPQDAVPYLGHYAVTVPANEERDEPEWRFEFDMAHTDGHLGGEMEIFKGWPAQIMYFAPAADQIFNLVYTINGSVAGIWDTMFIEFDLDETGRAVSFEARDGEDDELWMSGERIDE